MKLVIEGLALIADDLNGRVALYDEGEIFCEVLPSHGNSASHNASVLTAMIKAHDQLVVDLEAQRNKNALLAASLNQADAVRDQLVTALIGALPFVEDVAKSPDFKHGYVATRITEIRAALAAAGAK